MRSNRSLRLLGQPKAALLSVPMRGVRAISILKPVRVRNTCAAIAFIGVGIFLYARGETDIRIFLLCQIGIVVGIFRIYDRAKPVFWPKEEPVLYKREPRWWEGRLFKELIREAQSKKNEHGK